MPAAMQLQQCSSRVAALLLLVEVQLHAPLLHLANCTMNLLHLSRKAAFALRICAQLLNQQLGLTAP
eukprot:1158938-Pelagomonas_calceolata.AAC.10